MIALLFATTAAAAEPPYAAKTPLPTPTVFAPGAISTGDFGRHRRSCAADGTIYFGSDREGGLGGTGEAAGILRSAAAKTPL